MEAKIIDFVEKELGRETILYVGSKMSMNKMTLREADAVLYERIGDLIDQFVEDNEIDAEWFEENFLSAEDVFESIWMTIEDDLDM